MPPLPPARSIEERQASAVLRILDDDPTIGKIVEIASNAVERLARVAGADACAIPKPACAKGCSFCCHLVNIAVAIPEVVAIAEYLKRNARPGEVKALRQRINSDMEWMHEASREELYAIRRPCPLLVDDCCSVYEVRPLACRGWNSLDVDKCEEDFHHPERNVETQVSLPMLEGATKVRQGLYRGLGRAGLQHDRVDFIAALKLALDQADAVRQWLDGEPFVTPDP